MMNGDVIITVLYILTEVFSKYRHTQLVEDNATTNSIILAPKSLKSGRKIHGVGFSTPVQ